MDLLFTWSKKKRKWSFQSSDDTVILRWCGCGKNEKGKTLRLILGLDGAVKIDEEYFWKVVTTRGLKMRYKAGGKE